MVRRTKRDCNATVRYDDRIGFVNAPFRSVTFRRTKEIRRGKKRKIYRGNWTATGSASEVRLARNPQDEDLLAPGCSTLYMNYVPAEPPENRFQDPVTGKRAKELFLKGNRSPMKEKVGYRYTTAGDRDAAMVSVPTGFMRVPRRRPGARPPEPKPVSLWAFVKRDCVRTPRETNPASKITSLYFSEIRICDGLKPSDAVKKLNQSTSRAKRFVAIKPCRLPNAATQPGQSRPDHPEDGWNVGSVRRP